jgi:hypothetical protein
MKINLTEKQILELRQALCSWERYLSNRFHWAGQDYDGGCPKDWLDRIKTVRKIAKKLNYGDKKSNIGCSDT